MSAAVAVASGRARADLLIAGGRLVNVFTGETYEADVLVAGRLVAGVYDPADGETPKRRQAAERVVEAGGAYLVPGLIDGHVHIESSLVSAREYARGVLPRGVTGVVCDPHEIANVLGEPGVEWLLADTAELPFDVWVTVPSCVPSSPFETIGAEFDLGAMERLMAHPRVVGVAELMSYPAVVAGDDEVLAKAWAGESKGLTVEGHAPGLSGAGLQAYLASGVGSDHEATTYEEGLDKLRSGAFLMVREGSVTRDLNALMPLVREQYGERIGFVTDDRLPHDLLTEGGVDLLVRRAIGAGVDPAYAVRCASLNVALHYGLARRGAIAPGYFADLSIVPTLEEFMPVAVYKSGVLVARDGLADLPERTAPQASDDGVLRTVALPGLTERSFEVRAGGAEGGSAVRVRCVVARPNSIVTGEEVVDAKVVGGVVVADADRDVLKLACVERYGKHVEATAGSGLRSGVGLGFVRGFGLSSGALASSVGHDHHNLMIVGANDGDMLVAAGRLEELGGGFVAANDGEVVAELPLPLAGLMTNWSLRRTDAALTELDAAAARLGCTLPSPYMALSFLGLAVVPDLKLTDLGLVDVGQGRFVDLFVE